ncbi:hypothetical protein PLESTB_001230800 [Pleodorina starrii]|uniref:Uncharacterized protein n=1 Tax=Pleodorina starrii TaxID=330485 RepID=A0A9W6BSR1_9CHLO|nr:hypothetical protein PLESTM_000229300 [Pleodorina starrii]GLC57473.1 hypothetical protein PLESTB_001230800 [Pleodorina starrii]GLC77646.1 hypothetical protein PLESTF_001967200 [Pleodorina starrii]
MSVRIGTASRRRTAAVTAAAVSPRVTQLLADIAAAWQEQLQRLPRLPGCPKQVSQQQQIPTPLEALTRVLLHRSTQQEAPNIINTTSSSSPSNSSATVSCCTPAPAAPAPAAPAPAPSVPSYPIPAAASSPCCWTAHLPSKYLGLYLDVSESFLDDYEWGTTPAPAPRHSSPAAGQSSSSCSSINSSIQVAAAASSSPPPPPVQQQQQQVSAPEAEASDGATAATATAAASEPPPPFRPWGPGGQLGGSWGLNLSEALQQARNGTVGKVAAPTASSMQHSTAAGRAHIAHKAAGRAVAQQQQQRQQRQRVVRFR